MLQREFISLGYPDKHRYVKLSAMLLRRHILLCGKPKHGASFEIQNHIIGQKNKLLSNEGNF